MVSPHCIDAKFVSNADCDDQNDGRDGERGGDTAHEAGSRLLTFRITALENAPGNL
jgi:hypothetical protein